MGQDKQDPDGFYETHIKQPEGKSVIFKDIAVLQTKLEELFEKLDEFKVPQTVSVFVEYELNKGQIIKAGTERMLLPGETLEEAHEKLYSQVLTSILKMV